MEKIEIEKWRVLLCGVNLSLIFGGGLSFNSFFYPDEDCSTLGEYIMFTDQEEIASPGSTKVYLNLLIEKRYHCMTRLHLVAGFFAMSILIRLSLFQSHDDRIHDISVKHNHQSILDCSKILSSLDKINVALVSLLENGGQIGFEAKTSFPSPFWRVSPIIALR